MTNKKILEGNKLIAGFMGMVLVDGLWEVRTDDAVFLFNELYEGYCDKDHLIFHLSWSWLMPVVEKINKLIDNDSKCRKYFYDALESIHYCDSNLELLDYFMSANIKVIWKIVVLFIKWYNKEK